MTKDEMTSQQELAVYLVFKRQPLTTTAHRFDDAEHAGQRKLDYQSFRNTVQPGYGCVMIQWCGMWLGIEPDGYVHS